MQYYDGGNSMKVKRYLCGLLSAVFIASSCVAAVPISAIANTIDKDAEENRAWLSELYIRETLSDFGNHDMIPIADVYNRTLEEYLKDVETLKALTSVDFDKLGEAYVRILETVFDLLNKVDVGLSYEEMKSYLETEWKIIFPAEEDSSTLTYTTVVYACLKYDLLYPLMGIHFTVPQNTTLEHAVVLILSTVLNEEIEADIDTIYEYTIYNIKQSLIENGYQITPDANPDELLALYKIMMAEQRGYVIENQNIAAYTQADWDYLNAAFVASYINLFYDITPTVEDTSAALKNTGDANALATMILRTMITTQGGTVSANESLETLFRRACEAGYFQLDTELYADIYEYEVYLTYNCKEIWLAPYAYADELGVGEVDNVTITINGTQVNNGDSFLFPLTGDTTIATVSLVYDNGEIHDTATYTFTIFNGTEEIPEHDLLPELPVNGGDFGMTGGSGNRYTGGSSSNLKPIDSSFNGLLQLYDIGSDSGTQFALTDGSSLDAANRNGGLNGNSNPVVTATSNSDNSNSNIMLPIILSACACGLIITTTVGILIYRKRRSVGIADEG